MQTVGLTKYYGRHLGIEDVNLDVSEGEVFGFLGPNGAGKSTTIRTILDEIRPTAGSATILGLDTRAEAVEIRRHIGYIPGDLALYPNLTGMDTLQYFANMRGGVDWTYVDELADRLDSDLSRKVGDLSTGNRQKVGVIQAFMHHPDLLIMDEPTSGLDPLIQREFQKMVSEVAAEGRTVFLSSHTLSEVQRVADRVGIIRNGRLITVESVADLRSKSMREVEFVLDTEGEASVFESVEGVRNIVVAGNHVEMSFGGDMGELLTTVTERYGVADIKTTEADLEEIFLTYYHEDEGEEARS
ncbi:MAG: ABC transporter ATP-binding protein [Chloroflexi bacterium]|nr:ABC transporter ATP-binding protein [Chloroflexota bacterium]MYK61938.1 ABC transporter ATP-binding protein [Chloroflexota bacterium]